MRLYAEPIAGVPRTAAGVRVEPPRVMFVQVSLQYGGGLPRTAPCLSVGRETIE